MAKDVISKLTWVQVADILKKRLSSGEYTSGKVLPSYRTIASELNVSLSVCQRAMGQLQREGLVRITQGRAGQIGDPKGLENDFSFFGVIHPYNPKGDFGRFLNAHIMESFSAMTPISFPLILSSRKKGTAELRAAMQMIHNRVRGLLLSPVTDSENADFFAELSRKIPIILFDQELPGSGLPIVKFDYAATGNALGDALKRAKRKRLLILVQKDPNKSLQELTAAAEEKISTEVCPMEFFANVSDAIERQDPAVIRKLVAQISAAVRKSECDSLFCPYDSLLDMLIVNGLPDRMLGNLQLATLNGGYNRLPSLRYFQHGIWQWETSMTDLIDTAVHRLVRWTINHHAPSVLKKIPMKRVK